MLNIVSTALEDTHEEIKHSQKKVRAQIKAVSARPPVERSTRSLARLNNTIDHITAIADKAVALIEGSFCPQRVKALYELRLFQTEHKIDRAPRHPDQLVTALIIMCCVIAEGALAGAMFALEGKMGIVAGLAYGSGFSLTNIALGLVIGYFTLRYWNLKHVTKSVWKFKAAAVAGFIVLVSLLALLIISAALVRATGSHHGIFTDFSFAATFNDGFTLIIFTIGLLGSLVAIFEGYAGISDPIPNYSDIDRAVKRLVDEPAEELVDSTVEEIEDLYEDAYTNYEESTYQEEEAYYTRGEEIDAVVEAIEIHNQLVAESELEVSSMRKTQEWIEQYCSNDTQESFDSYVVSPKEVLNKLSDTAPLSDGHEDDLARLTTAKTFAISKLSAAHIAFLNHTTTNKMESK